MDTTTFENALLNASDNKGRIIMPLAYVPGNINLVTERLSNSDFIKFATVPSAQNYFIRKEPKGVGLARYTFYTDISGVEYTDVGGATGAEAVTILDKAKAFVRGIIG